MGKTPKRARDAKRARAEEPTKKQAKQVKRTVRPAAKYGEGIGPSTY